MTGTAGTTPSDYIELYRDAAGSWRWRYKAGGNNKVLADSGEGYIRQKDAYGAAWRVTNRQPTLREEGVLAGDIELREIGS